MERKTGIPSLCIAYHHSSSSSASRVGPSGLFCLHFSPPFHLVVSLPIPLFVI
jgi:hypothetical protein